MITVYNCGYDSKHPSVFDMLRLKGNNDYCILLIKTNAFFEINGVIIETKPNTAILYDKHTYVHYGCHEPNFNDDWIHFDTSEDESDFLNSLPFSLNTPYPLDYMGHLNEYARLIVTEKLSSNIHKDEIIDALMHALLYSLSAQINSKFDERSKNKYFFTLNQIRMEIMNAPHKKWRIDSLAAKCNLSSTHFQRLYKSFFSTTCTQDIINARIKNAQFYLRTTEMSIYSLSAFCGYDNELHFMRQFKKYTGLTPSEYRKLNY